MPAAGALQQRCPHRPRFVVPASRTTKTLRPAELTQILSTGLLGGETRLELGQIPRIIFHFPDPTSCGHLSQVNTHHYFFYVVGHPETGDDIWYLERGATGGGWESHPFRDTPFNETSSTFSPDGRYAAFTADDTGRYEVYVQDFPGGDRTWTVSSNGGSAPKWRGDGKELFYFEGDTLMTVSVSNNPVFSAGTPKRLFTHGDTGQAPLRGYDVTDDGQTFVVVEPAEDAGPPVIRVVENWYEEFRDREQD